MINRNQLAIFHAVAEEGGIGLGARRLHISQPAVSAQIAELESALGVKLFERLPRGVRLTEAGELLAGYARRIALLEAEAEAAIRDLVGLRRGRLAIGASTTIGAYLLPALLRQFRRQYPEISLELEIANTERIQQHLLDGTLALGLTEGLADEQLLEVEVFREDELVPVVGPGHPLTQRRRVTPRAFLSNPLILRERGSGTRKIIEQALAARGFSIGPSLSLGSTEAVKGAVAAGLGVAFVSSLALAPELETGRLHQVGIVGFKIRRPLHLLRLRGRPLPPSASAFLDLLHRSNRPGVREKR